jgi:hypothetical protein
MTVKTVRNCSSSQVVPSPHSSTRLLELDRWLSINHRIFCHKKLFWTRNQSCHSESVFEIFRPFSDFFRPKQNPSVSVRWKKIRPSDKIPSGQKKIRPIISGEKKSVRPVKFRPAKKKSVRSKNSVRPEKNPSGQKKKFRPIKNRPMIKKSVRPGKKPPEKLKSKK